MQTFLPYASFTKSASVLDNKRLGKQRVECLQILKSLTIPTYGWKNHPIVRMWRNHEVALCHYGMIMCDEWINRGFNDTTKEKIHTIALDLWKTKQYRLPDWMCNNAFHLSHQSNLLRKDYNYYKNKFSFVEPNLPYQWYNPDTNIWYTT